MPSISDYVAMALSIVEMFGGKLIFAAAMTIVLAVAALSYIAERIFNK